MAAAVAVIVFVGVWLFGGLVDLLLLGFAGVLLALLLDGLASQVARHTPLGRKTSLAVVCVALLFLAGAVGWVVAPRVAHQVDELARALPPAARTASAGLSQYGWGRALLDEIPELASNLGTRKTISQATGALSAVIGVFGSFVVFLVVGLFVAVEPGLYRDGAVRLVPMQHRARAREVLGRVATTLRYWLLGNLVSMTFVGVGIGIGLLALGMPLVLTLALLAALLTLVPNFGPILAAIPAVLLGWTASTNTGLSVAGLYLAIQMVESNVVTPLVQKRTVSLPPALTILAQVGMGMIGGGLGIIVAAPLTAVALVLVRSLYVEDILGDRGYE
ncbi:MAG: AI-2E family transporter [Deltaproteobacteria bacterium]|nr:AI-2E family transporter [Deltaproteobacteria bacterium]